MRLAFASKPRIFFAEELSFGPNHHINLTISFSLHIFARIFFFIVHSAQDHVNDNHDDELTHPTGTKSAQTLESPSHQKAVEALQLLLRKLPNKLALKDQLNDIRNDDHDNSVTIKQYSIPRDPIRIPQFKPIKPPAFSTTYTFKVGPVESVSHHSAGGHGDPVALAAAAAAVSGGGDHTKYAIIQNQPQHQPPAHTQSYQSAHNSPLSASSAYGAPNQSPLSLYHTMALKNGHTHPNQPSHSHPHQHPPPVFYLPGEQRPFQVQGFQKSIEYRLH